MTGIELSGASAPEPSVPLDELSSPAGIALREAERFNETVAHENRGFLSWSRGFVPSQTPLSALNRQFAAWDELAAELPVLYRDLSLRRRVETLPLLDASPQDLEDGELLRAAALLAIVSHAYWYVEPKPPEALAPALQLPWQQVRARLGRSQEVLTYTDLVVYNWRFLNPALPDPLRVENTALLLPTIGNREENVFYLTQLEILARCSVAVRAFVKAHEAILRDEAEAVEQALVEMIDCLDQVVSDSLLKINPNPYSESFVDPVVWAKTVAPLAVPFHAGDQGPSGTSSPIFNAFDTFFRRPKNSSFLGREIEQLRAHYPPFWRQFLDGLSRVSVIDFVQAKGKPSLSGALREAMELYSGEHGFLGRHRMKVYGYLELAFKVGRSVTIGGFSGTFTDRTWDQVDDELEASRHERLAQRPESYQRAMVERVVPGPGACSVGIQRVVLDVAESGVRFRTGSRCRVLPENRIEVVEKTIRALSASGDELVGLTEEWRRALLVRLGEPPPSALPLRELLRFGAIRPVSARLAEALHARTQDLSVLAQMRAGTTERWELWELLELLSSSGLSVRTLWQDSAGQVDERLARLIPPERSRLYSISSVAPADSNTPPRTIELTVGHLRYCSEPARLTMSPPRGSPRPGEDCLMREGTASSFLIQAGEQGRPVRFRIERPARFQPPADPKQPIVLFAAGTGVAPYRAFIQDRAREPEGGQVWLFLSLRAPSEMQLGEEFAAAQRLRLSVAFTREGGDLVRDAERGFVAVPGPVRRIEDLLADEEVAKELLRLLHAPAEGGAGAAVYVCGRSGFAATVIQLLEGIFERHFEAERPGHARSGKELVRKLVGENRLVLELHTDAKPIADEPRWISFSEVAQRNNATAGYWLVIDQVVYDLTEFSELHPGGRTIVRAYAGIDAGHAYGRAHERQPDVDAMREMYQIGRIRPLSFEDYAAVVNGPNGAARLSIRAVYQSWVRALHLVVEMQNAHNADLGLLSAVVSPVEAPHVVGAFKLSRGVETHMRFLRNCLKPLRVDTLPALWSITRGVFALSQGETWMQDRLRQIGRDQRNKYVKAMSLDLVEDIQRWLEHEGQLVRLLAAARLEDTRLLEELKRLLVQGVQAFEEFGVQTRQLGAESLIATCRSAVAAVQEYYERLDSQWRRICGAPAAHRGRSSSQWPATHTRRLYESELWVLEEFPEQQIAVLRRTPVPAVSLLALAADNDALVASLRDEHRGFGLVVDMREAPLRNDQAFEEAMARLRNGLTSRFERTAVLLDSPLGELQVNRLERDAGRSTFVTRSVSAAFRFAAGGR